MVCGSDGTTKPPHPSDDARLSAIRGIEKEETCETGRGAGVVRSLFLVSGQDGQQNGVHFLRRLGVGSLPVATAVSGPGAPGTICGPDSSFSSADYLVTWHSGARLGLRVLRSPTARFLG